MKENFIADALIFDIDGVLLDVSCSFPEVIRLAVKGGWQKFCGGESDGGGYCAGHEWALKRHGGFNDDYDIAWTLLSMAAASGEKKLSDALPTPERLEEELKSFFRPLPQWVRGRYGDRVPRAEARALCAGLYGCKGYGLHLLERPMLKRHWRELGLPVAVYSGRNALEWELAKESLGWEDFPDELIIHSDHGIEKPSPKGLEILCERLGVSSPVFFGDTASDMQAQQAFGVGRFAAVGGLLPEARLRFDTTELAVAAFAPASDSK
ncbi:MAG: HAD family hydrolase [Synergistaceae bacterium]|nr:HAD family hydrolase [Synergistaceae bacterium]